MFDILRKSFSTGVVTERQDPQGLAGIRGRPEIPFEAWKDARPSAAACPTGAISATDEAGTRSVSFDLGKCTFCGLCAEADLQIRMTEHCELAAAARDELVTRVRYSLAQDGTQQSLLSKSFPSGRESTDLHQVGKNIRRLLGRSLHIRQVDAGSCNGCELEIAALNNPVYDLEQYGIHFVASPRHADMLLVTGPVTRNMELALRKTFAATPEPRLVVAVGACGCSGGIFGINYATRGAVAAIIPVDVYVPGCPPSPRALLHGIFTAVHRRMPR